MAAVVVGAVGVVAAGMTFLYARAGRHRVDHSGGPDISALVRSKLSSLSSNIGLSPLGQSALLRAAVYGGALNAGLAIFVKGAVGRAVLAFAVRGALMSMGATLVSNLVLTHLTSRWVGDRQHFTPKEYFSSGLISLVAFGTLINQLTPVLGIRSDLVTNVILHFLGHRKLLSRPDTDQIPLTTRSAHISWTF